jgi:hypothetical protein
MMHSEPIAWRQKIEWYPPEGWSAEDIGYYAAQGNATRIFVGSGFRSQLTDWREVKTLRLSALAYAASGGYSGPQLYPGSILLLIKGLEKVLDFFPVLFATRLLIILEK